MSPKSSPSCQVEGKGFYQKKLGSFRGVQAGAMFRTAQSAPTVILKLVMRWSGQHHLASFLFFWVLLAMLRGLQDLSSLTRDRTQAPGSESVES